LNHREVTIERKSKSLESYEKVFGLNGIKSSV
jgi:hypothetical protein